MMRVWSEESMVREPSTGIRTCWASAWTSGMNVRVPDASVGN